MRKSFDKKLSFILTIMISTFFIPMVTYASNEADTIYCSVDADDYMEFEEEDFNDACISLMSEELDYIYFELPDSDEGTLFYDYGGGEEAEVDDADEYYYETEPSISYVTFVPDDDCSNTVTISYEGVDLDGNFFSGDIVIEVEDSDNDLEGDIEYSVDTGDEVSFDEDDFNNYCQDENDEEIYYINFSLPSSSKGVLYYDYNGDDEEKVDDSNEYYYDDNPSIADVTFVPDDDFTGECEIDFEGFDVNGDSIEGKVVISVLEKDLGTVDTIYFTGYSGSAIPFVGSYFNSRCLEIADSTLSYVKFTPPSSSSGTLYYGYVSEDNYSSKVSDSEIYYYESNYPELSEVSFVPVENSSGTVSLTYIGYAEDGSSFTGYLDITFTAPVSDASSSVYFSDVNNFYSWAVPYVDRLYADGFLTGEILADNTRTFNPSVSITRGDFILMLARAFNLQSTATMDNFSDVAIGTYYYDAIAAAKELGIAQGFNNQFQPEFAITREDAMVLVLRAMNLAGASLTEGSVEDLSVYSDFSSVSSYAEVAIASLIKSGVVTGNSDGKIYPQNDITRVEAAAVIYRIKY